MSQTATSKNSQPKNTGRGPRNERSPRSNGAAFVAIAIGTCLLGAALFLGGERVLSLLPRDVTLRQVLLWLNPAFSALRMDELPFFQGLWPDKSRMALQGEESSHLEPREFQENENPYCETAGTGQSREVSIIGSSVGFPLENVTSSPISGHSGVSLSDKPKGIDTSIARIAQAMKDPASTVQGQANSKGKDADPQSVDEKDTSQKEPEPEAAQNEASVKDKRTQGRASSSASPVAAGKDTPEWEAESRSEQFQLPGSITVKIQGYSGSTVKWDLAVILDDSDSMARQFKGWNPSRFKTALTFIEKLPGALSSGSRLAVRDFACGVPDDKKNAKKVCLSHMLLEWTNMPVKQLKEGLEKADSGGATDPCAAAAYSIKKDFQGGTGRKPRILIVTGGASTVCSVGAVIRAIDSSDATRGTVVDVLALGIHKKRQKGYATLASRTGGVFIDAERPADIDQPFARYAKVLQAKHFEKVEIKGDKASLSIAPFQEITLAPGTYTVILPVVEGLDPSKRIVPNVKIGSGETNVLDVAIRKGKPIIKTVKK